MVEFQYVQAMNFMSYERFRVSFLTSGVRLVQGQNGAGKSSIYEALLWGLYGKTLRGTTEVMRNHVEDKLLVRVVFTIAKASYAIERSRNKDDKARLRLFHITPEGDVDKSAGTNTGTQTLIEDLLQADFKTFVAATCFGGSQTFRFSSLTDVERLDVLNRVLDVEVYSQAAKLAGRSFDQASFNYEECIEERDRAARLVEEASERLGVLNKEAETTTKDIDVDLAKLENRKNPDELVKKIQTLRGKLDELQEDASELTTKFATAKADYDRLCLTRKKAERGLPCTSCGSFFSWTKDRDDELKASSRVLEAVQTEMTANRLAVSRKKGHIADLEDLLEDARDDEKQYLALKAERKLLATKDGAALQRRQEAEDELAKRVHAHGDLKEQAKLLKQEVQQLEFVCRLLKSEVPRAAIEGAIPVLNDRARDVASFLGGPGFSVTFATSRETKTGKEVAKLDLIVAPASDGAATYQGSSQGEKAVADICAGLALQAAAAGRASFNVAFYDEVFDALDASVAERVISLLRKEGKARAVFVCSHAAWLQAESFDTVYAVSKEEGTSAIHITKSRGRKEDA